MIVYFTAETAHLITEYGPESDSQRCPNDKKSRIQKPLLAIQYWIFCNYSFIQPFINKSFMADHNAHQDYKSNSTHDRNTSRNSFRYPSESHLETSPAQGYSTIKEHGSIHNQ